MKKDKNKKTREDTTRWTSNEAEEKKNRQCFETFVDRPANKLK